jgi:ABC-type multidrug transport system fused ATPase/permease subunit
MFDSIMKVIYAKFVNATVINITSRIETLMNCDKVIVIERGRIIEIGNPFELIQHSRGQLRLLLDQSDFTSTLNMIRIAEKNYFHLKKT